MNDILRLFQRTILLSGLFFTVFTLGAQEFNQTDAEGRKQGIWKKMFPTGEMRYEGEFKDDQAIGLFKYYYKNGKLRATNNHIGGGAVANHMYHPNGKIKAKGLYQNKEKDSLWQYFNEDERLIIEETYAENKLNGAQRKYYENAQMGEETNFQMGEKHGPWLKFFDNGKPWLEGNYLNGNLDGAFRIFTEKGKTQTQGKYSSGLRIGTWLMFNENGSVRTQNSYANGVLKKQKPENGEFTEYFMDDIPKSVYNYKGGKKNGEFKEYYEAGEWVQKKVPGKMGGPDEMETQLVGTKLKMKGWYNLGELNGKLRHYKEDGSVDRIEVWESGKLVSTIEWDGVSDE